MVGFGVGRSHNSWLDRPVGDDQLTALYDVLKWAPTSANSAPARFVFVKSMAQKDRLVACMAPGNAAKTALALVTAIIGMDLVLRKTGRLNAADGCPILVCGK